MCICKHTHKLSHRRHIFYPATGISISVAMFLFVPSFHCLFAIKHISSDHFNDNSDNQNVYNNKHEEYTQILKVHVFNFKYTCRHTSTCFSFNIRYCKAVIHFNSLQSCVKSMYVCKKNTRKVRVGEATE